MLAYTSHSRSRKRCCDTVSCKAGRCALAIDEKSSTPAAHYPTSVAMSSPKINLKEACLSPNTARHARPRVTINPELPAARELRLARNRRAPMMPIARDSTHNLSDYPNRARSRPMRRDIVVVNNPGRDRHAPRQTGELEQIVHHGDPLDRNTCMPFRTTRTQLRLAARPNGPASQTITAS